MFYHVKTDDKLGILKYYKKKTIVWVGCPTLISTIFKRWVYNVSWWSLLVVVETGIPEQSNQHSLGKWKTVLHQVE